MFAVIPGQFIYLKGNAFEHKRHFRYFSNYTELLPLVEKTKIP